MYIETERTPNPATLKFLPDQTVLESGSHYFGSMEEAAPSPLAQEVFAVEGVSAVLLGVGFLSVTIEAGDWQEKKTDVLSAIMGHYMTGNAVIEDNVSVASSEGDPESVKMIKAILEEKVRPAIAQDGGDVIFGSFEDGIVYLQLQGACDGCPSASMTLKNGIESLLKYYVPEVTEVRQVR